MSAGEAPSAPIPIRQQKRLPMPAVSAALGMAASYYGYPFFISVSVGMYLFLLALLLFVVVVSFLRVIRLPFMENSLKVPAFVSKLGILAVAAAVGFSLGIASRRTVSGPAETGIAAERVIAVSGLLREDPRSLRGSGLGTLELLECVGEGGIRASARGSLTVFFPSESIPRLKEFGRGCEVYADGVLSRAIKTAGSRGPVFNATSVHIVKPAPALEQFRTGLRMTLLEKFQGRQGAKYRDGDAPVWGSFASAMLLGMRDDLEADFSEAFRNSGCSYILALSGMHLAILSGILAFLIRRPLGIRWASLVGALFIVFYVFIAGSQPSLVRSAIMYLIASLALWGLLKTRAISLLGMAFIIQLLFQSETGISISFILSYLALAGMLTLGETFHSFFRGRLPEILNRALSASLGAFIFTAPVVAHFFGTLKPIGIIAGLLVVPLSSVFMVLSLAALAAAFIPFPLWSIFDFVLTWFYRLLELIVSLAGRVPGLFLSNPVPVLVVSILLWVLVLFIQKQDSLHRSSIASFD